MSPYHLLGRPAALAATLVLLSGSGCSRDTVVVRGRLVKDGQPYPVNVTGDRPDTVAVMFVGKIDGVEYMLPATFQPDGSFKVVGADGRGIKRGRYKVTALHSGYMGEGEERFKTKYTLENTPLAVDLTKDTDLTIDIGAGTLTQK